MKLEFCVTERGTRKKGAAPNVRLEVRADDQGVQLAPHLALEAQEAPLERLVVGA